MHNNTGENMIENLEIKNATLSPNFDPLNNIYTVNVSGSITSLMIDYEISDEYEVIISGNEEFKVGENKILIYLTKNNEVEEIYEILVNKSEVVEAFSESETFEVIEVTGNSVKTPDYVVYFVGLTALLLIYIVFKILFKKKKRI